MQLDHRGVDPGGSRTWTNRLIRDDPFTTQFPVRAEVMGSPGCKGKKYADSTSSHGNGQTIWLNQNQVRKQKFYWDLQDLPDSRSRNGNDK